MILWEKRLCCNILFPFIYLFIYDYNPLKSTLTFHLKYYTSYFISIFFMITTQSQQSFYPHIIFSSQTYLLIRFLFFSTDNFLRKFLWISNFQFFLEKSHYICFFLTLAYFLLNLSVFPLSINSPKVGITNVGYVGTSSWENNLTWVSIVLSGHCFLSNF